MSYDHISCGQVLIHTKQHRSVDAVWCGCGELTQFICVVSCPLVQDNVERRILDYSFSREILCYSLRCIELIIPGDIITFCCTTYIDSIQTRVCLSLEGRKVYSRGYASSNGNFYNRSPEVFESYFPDLHLLDAKLMANDESINFGANPNNTGGVPGIYK